MAKQCGALAPGPSSGSVLDPTCSWGLQAQLSSAEHHGLTPAACPDSPAVTASLILSKRRLRCPADDNACLFLCQKRSPQTSVVEA